MLVIDGNVIRRIQTEDEGIDFMELSANLIRAHQRRYASTPSILDSDTTSKGLSPISLGYSPPSYEDIFGDKNLDLPPSYSELSLLFKQRQIQLGEVSELRSFHSTVIKNQVEVQETNLTEIVIEETPRNVEDASRNVEDTTRNVEETLRNVEVSVPFESYPTDFSSSNCRYCIMSLDSERRAKIKCYCQEESEVGGPCSSITIVRNNISDSNEVNCTDSICSSDSTNNNGKDEISEMKESSL